MSLVPTSVVICNREKKTKIVNMVTCCFNLDVSSFQVVFALLTYEHGQFSVPLLMNDVFLVSPGSIMSTNPLSETSVPLASVHVWEKDSFGIQAAKATVNALVSFIALGF